ncbi:MAG: endoglucanase [Deltaproteobacteria bacterium]|nr:endoglucanase [Deltaproteobacteria bacterium]
MVARIILCVALLFPVISPVLCHASPAGDPLLWGFALDGYPIRAETIERVERETGLYAQIVVFFLQWPAPGAAGALPRESLDAVRSRGAIPVVTWEPMYYKEGREIVIPQAEILGGRYNSYLDSFAREAKAWGKPFMIRFAHEMNISRYHWGTEEQEYGPGSPRVYRDMFRHVVSRFRKMGANNVLWVFCPNAESVPNASYDPTASWNQARRYYPGDEYVDVLGMDGYNWGTTRTKERHGWESRWKSFREVFQPIYEELKTLSTRKPLFIFETASADQGGEKNDWIREALITIGQWDVQGCAWFQVEKEVDWRIQSGVDLARVAEIRSRTSWSLNWIQRLVDKKEK